VLRFPTLSILLQIGYRAQTPALCAPKMPKFLVMMHINTPIPVPTMFINPFEPHPQPMQSP
jgi:hypothetical protein